MICILHKWLRNNNTFIFQFKACELFPLDFLNERLTITLLNAIIPLILLIIFNILIFISNFNGYDNKFSTMTITLSVKFLIMIVAKILIVQEADFFSSFFTCLAYLSHSINLYLYVSSVEEFRRELMTLFKIDDDPSTDNKRDSFINDDEIF